MRMYDHPVFGKKAGERRAEILRGLREGKVMPDVYVVTPPLSGSNLLEIYPSAELLLPPLNEEDRLIAGVAVTYWEALEVVRTMIDMGYKRGDIC